MCCSPLRICWWRPNPPQATGNSSLQQMPSDNLNMTSGSNLSVTITATDAYGKRPRNFELNTRILQTNSTDPDVILLSAYSGSLVLSGNVTQRLNSSVNGTDVHYKFSLQASVDGVKSSTVIADVCIIRVIITTSTVTSICHGSNISVLARSTCNTS